MRGRDRLGASATAVSAPCPWVIPSRMPVSLSPDDVAVAPLVRKTAAWSWRLVVIAAAAWVLLKVLTRLGVVIVPVALALMLTALLVPAVDFLDRRGAPRGGAVALVLICGLAAVGGILAFVVTQFADGLPQLVDQVTQSIDSTRRWLINGPLHLRPDQINHFGDTAIQTLRDHQQELTSGALSTAGTVTEIVTGALLALFTLIFLLLGGRNIWHFVTQLAPATVRQRVRDAGAAGFHSLTGYVRATSLVALVDAAGIGTGLAIMGIPLALPLASLVFLGAFIPLVGAVLSGFFAVVVALLAKGFVYALITLGVVIAVMQLEAHVLQPLVMGRAVSIHPLAVVLGISAGGVIAGIVGALLAVPTIAFFNSAARVVLARDPDEEKTQQEAGEAPLLEAEPDRVDEHSSQ
jgi:putative heme transporter